MRKPRPTATPSNLRSHSGEKVHAGKWQWIPHLGSWRQVPVCGLRRNSTAFGLPTDELVTCSKCS